MSAALILLPIALVPVLYALLLKLSAFLLRRTQMSWKHAFVFGLLGLAVGVVGSLANRVTGYALPGLVVGLLGFAIQISLGGWYFGPRARTAAGEAVGFARGALLSLVSFAIVFLFGVGAAILVPVLQNASQA